MGGEVGFLQASVDGVTPLEGLFTKQQVVLKELFGRRKGRWRMLQEPSRASGHGLPLVALHG
jgi:hypothetical protein